MNDSKKTKAQLIDELQAARRQIATLANAPQSQDLGGRGDQGLRAERDAVQPLMDGVAATGIGVDVVDADYKRQC